MDCLLDWNIDQINHYLEESLLPRTIDFDILAWWRTNGIKYPTLHDIARDILAIHVSTVASESAFSTSGRIVSPHRNRLHSKIVEALTCTRDWLWNEIKFIENMLYKFTIKFNSSTIALESCFSACGRVVSEKRASLSPNTIEALICLKDWALANSRKQDAAEDEQRVEELMNIKASRPDWMVDSEVDISSESKKRDL
ncbi:unnamed protein product [Prunus brigantina]